jgi:hypothetical protein
MPESATESGANSPGAVELKHALHAFKRRLKLMRQEEESSLGRGPLSGGKRSTIVAIVPPNQFPWPVWDALVEQGKLLYSGHGLYELANDPNKPR